MIQKPLLKLTPAKTLGAIISVLLPVIVIVQPTFSQTSFKAAEGSSVSISGTSTFHDWEMISENVKSRAVFVRNTNGELSHAGSVDFSVRVKTLKSDKSKLDQNAYKALDAEKFPVISFQAINSDKIVRQNGDHCVRVKGRLTVSGVTKEKYVEAVCTYRDKDTMICEGEINLAMTEFGVKPPTFMLGVMTTGDEITVVYRMIYITENE